jgi:hypothetical protein
MKGKKKHHKQQEDSGYFCTVGGTSVIIHIHYTILISVYSTKTTGNSPQKVRSINTDGR